MLFIYKLKCRYRVHLNTSSAYYYKNKKQFFIKKMENIKLRKNIGSGE